MSKPSEKLRLIVDEGVKIPSWTDDIKRDWGERVLDLPEWDESTTHRVENGWKGSDLIHSNDAPVRIMDYFVHFGRDVDNEKGGVGTKLCGVAYFSHKAESHAGYCHGGSMCSVIDDVIGWCAFLVTGECRPWSGYTVQIDTSLLRPIPVHSVLLVRSTIVKVERRKVFVDASIVDPSAEEDVIHARGSGLVILNRGILPDSESNTYSEQQASTGVYTLASGFLLE